MKTKVMFIVKNLDIRFHILLSSRTIKSKKGLYWLRKEIQCHKWSRLLRIMSYQKSKNKKRCMLMPKKF